MSDYFERTITIQLLDHLVVELDYIAVKFIILHLIELNLNWIRFDSSKTETIFNGFLLLTATLIIIAYQPQKCHCKEKLSLFSIFTKDVLPNA